MTNINGLPAVYSYAYQVNHVRVDLKGRLISNQFRLIQPYISGGFGVAFNNAHAFTGYSNYPIAYPFEWFGSNTTVGFAYTLGAGLQTNFAPNWVFGLGYEFADLGKSHLDGNGDTLVEGLELTHLYTNSLLFSLSYLF